MLENFDFLVSLLIYDRLNFLNSLNVTQKKKIKKIDNLDEIGQYGSGPEMRKRRAGN